MIWRFSDGTIAHLGGEIEGASLFAQELRAELEQPWVGVQTRPMPADGAKLNKNDPALFNAWLRQEMGKPYRKEQKLRLAEVPKGIPALPVEPADDDDIPADAVF